MNAKHILKVFNPDVKIKYIINEQIIEDIKTVKDFMNNGLTTYVDVSDGSLIIKDNTIILQIKTNN